jgi:hypothetical protein
MGKQVNKWMYSMWCAENHTILTLLRLDTTGLASVTSCMPCWQKADMTYQLMMRGDSNIII